MSEKNLAALRKGESGRVRALSGAAGQCRRLRDLGLVEGVEVRCLHVSPFGSPVAYDVWGAVIALRAEDAQTVLIG